MMIIGARSAAAPTPNRAQRISILYQSRIQLDLGSIEPAPAMPSTRIDTPAHLVSPHSLRRKNRLSIGADGLKPIDVRRGRPSTPHQFRAIVSIIPSPI